MLCSFLSIVHTATATWSAPRPFCDWFCLCALTSVTSSSDSTRPFPVSVVTPMHSLRLASYLPTYLPTYTCTTHTHTPLTPTRSRLELLQLAQHRGLLLPQARQRLVHLRHLPGHVPLRRLLLLQCSPARSLSSLWRAKRHRLATPDDSSPTPHTNPPAPPRPCPAP